MANEQMVKVVVGHRRDENDGLITITEVSQWRPFPRDDESAANTETIEEVIYRSTNKTEADTMEYTCRVRATLTF